MLCTVYALASSSSVYVLATTHALDPFTSSFIWLLVSVMPRAQPFLAIDQDTFSARVPRTALSGASNLDATSACIRCFDNVCNS